MKAVNCDVTRRGIVSGAALGVAGVAGVAALAGRGRALAEDAPDARVWDCEADVVVLGGGVGGTLAALRACELGVSVLLVEAGAELGGSLLISGACLHTYCYGVPATDIETMLGQCPTADKALATDFMTKWNAFCDEWLPTVGLPFVVQDKAFATFGSCYDERKQDFDYLQAAIEEKGGRVLLNTRGIDLVLAADGSVEGAELVADDGSHLFAKAPAVILACGGISADPVMKQAFMGTYADRSVPRTVPFNRGDGHRMALKAGGQLTEGMGCFYGHLVPFPSLVPSDPAAFAAADKDDLQHALMRVQYIDGGGIVVNIDGKRFTDENGRHVSTGDCWAAIQMTRQPQGYGWVIVDSFDDVQNPNIEELATLGATVLRADTLDDLVDQLAAQGVDKAGLQRTLKEFIEADAADMAVYSTAKAEGTATTFQTAPFFAIRVSAGVSAMLGGVKIDEEAHVVGRDGSPVRGLYATACCAGGFSYDDYVGSLSLSAVYGKQAAETAVVERA